MPKTPAAKSALKTASRPAVITNFRKQPELYRILRGEQGVFTTPPYSSELKGLWRFKDEATAQESAEQLFDRFESFRDAADFVGMDIARKFIQMGRTRSLRYALRPGGRKYDKESGQEIKRTGEVADEGKLKGAGIFEDYLKRIEDDEAYVSAKTRWRADVEGKKPAKARAKQEPVAEVNGTAAGKVKDELIEITSEEQLQARKRRSTSAKASNEAEIKNEQ